MDFQKQIDTINSTNRSERILQIPIILDLAKLYLNSGIDNDKLSLNFIDCINEIRQLRFIESDSDMNLLDVALLIARKMKNNQNLLENLLNDALYYSNYFPDKYNRLYLENEIKLISK